MVANTQKNGIEGVQKFVVGQLEEAKKQLIKFEKEIVSKGRQQRKELEALIKSVQSGKQVEALGSKVTEVGGELKKAFDGLQTKVVSAAGVATQEQVAQINRELARLSKKIDGLVSKKRAAN